ncbi:M28 family metallopeptidase [Nocardioides speluncae]|uniref:M28 family metallopeptidase n=1 Tax=Nocardioides speluncae TaxID=2670337 RepID=UPI000D6948B6|nr:M20/M25/M40 family metallo-hydrolase [Nocardioides speluncae]
MRIRSRAAVAGAALAVAGTVLTAGAGQPAAGEPQLADSPDISVTNTKAHLDALQGIANANGGNRATGRTGYRASVDWVKAKLDAAGFTTTVQEFTTGTLGTTKSWNVIAEWPHGDANHVVMTGAHLDSVSSGPGINDNGTGSAGVLETALAFAASGKTTKNRLKFAFWGAEEQGLVGSKYYSAQLPQSEKDKIELYLNFDMIGSPNPGYFVYDDNPAGDAARDQLTAYFDGKSIPWEYIDVQGRSDHASFRAAGIATSGTFTGAEGRKTSAQVAKWGGTATAFDPCYHAACDDIDNLDLTALDRNIDAIGHMVWLYADKDYGTTPPPTPGCTQTNGTDVGIGDNTTVESAVIVSGCSGNASATAKVAVNIAHTYIGDLKVDLVAPDGSVYVLHNRTGGSADNINTTYTVNLSSEVANGTWKLRVNDNAGGDTGKIDTWTLTTGGGGTTPPPTCAAQTNGTDFAIADNATVESPVTIAGCTGNATATAKVAVNIQHTYIGDLKVDLVAPDGTVYVLHNRAGGSADNINTTYTVNLSSEVANGTWKLRVNDNANQDTGKIDTWTLTP